MPFVFIFEGQIMKLKPLMAAFVVAFSSATAAAANYSVPGTLSGAYGNAFTTASGAFSDFLSFTIDAPSNLGSVASPTNLSFSLPFGGTINVFEISNLAYTITGPLGFTTTAPIAGNNVSASTFLNVAGVYTLNLTGNATGTSGGMYSVALNVENVAAVPEPETYALMLAGLGLVGFASRRKNNAV